MLKLHRLTALLLTFALVLSANCSTYALSFDMATEVPEIEENIEISDTSAIMTESVESVDTTESVGVIEDVSDVSDVSEASESSETETHTITGFSYEDQVLDFITVDADNRPSEQSLVENMPKTIDVKLDGTSQTVSINVSWECVSDYENSDSYAYQFSPVFTSSYTLDDSFNLLTDAPYVNVMLSKDYDAISTSDDAITITSSEIDSNFKTIYKFLVNEMSLNAGAACGIMANMYWESAVDPDTWGDFIAKGESKYSYYTADDKKSYYKFGTKDGQYGVYTCYGLCQWNTSRLEKLQNWCKSKGLDYKNINAQLQYLKAELDGESFNGSLLFWNGTQMYNELKNNSRYSDSASGAYNAANYWCLEYEQPYDKEKLGIIRGNYAKNTVYPTYALSIGNCNISLNTTSYTYSGGAKCPSATVKKSKNGKTLTQNQDYTITYTNNVEVGTATATITGIGSYTGSVDKSFVITLGTVQLADTSNATNGINVKWNAVVGADSYIVYRRKNNKQDWSLIATTSSLNYVDTAVGNGSNYYYTVCAVRGTVYGEFNKTGLRQLFVPQVSGLTLVSKKKKRLTVKAIKVQKATGYQIVYSLKSDFSKKKTVTVSGKKLSQVIKKLKSQKTYYVKVRAYRTLQGTKYYGAYSEVSSLQVK